MVRHKNKMHYLNVTTLISHVTLIYYCPFHQTLPTKCTKNSVNGNQMDLQQTAHVQSKQFTPVLLICTHMLVALAVFCMSDMHLYTRAPPDIIHLKVTSG